MRARHAVSLLWVFGLVAGELVAQPSMAEIDGVCCCNFAAPKNGERANVRPARAAAAGSCPPGRVDHP